MVQITVHEWSNSPGAIPGCTHGSGLVRKPAGELVQQMRANRRMSKHDNPLQTPPASVAPRGVAVPADMRWSTQTPSEGSTAQQSPSSVEETHQHAQQTLDIQQQQQHASTDRRDAAQAPARLQQHQHVMMDAGSAVCQPSDAAPLEKRPAAGEARSTATATSHHDDIHLIEPPPRCGLLAVLASAGEGQIAAEATPTADTQEQLAEPPETRNPAANTSDTSSATVARDTTTRLTESPLRCGLLEPAASGAWGGTSFTAPDTVGHQLPAQPPDRRSTAGEAGYDSTLIDTTVIACAANARARRRLRRESGRAAASPCSPFPQLDLGRLISRRHAATAIAAAARRRSACLWVQGVRCMHAQVQTERRERRAAIWQRGEEAAADSRRRRTRNEIRGRLLDRAVELHKLVPPTPMLVMIPDNGAGGREMLIGGVHAGGMQSVTRSPRSSRPGDVHAFSSSDLATALWPQERRIDVVDGRGYALEDFLETYGRTLEWDASVSMQVALDTAQLTQLPASSELITIGELDTAVLAYADRERQRLAPPGWLNTFRV
jgi:hypothetical protein